MSLAWWRIVRRGTRIARIWSSGRGLWNTGKRTDFPFVLIGHLLAELLAFGFEGLFACGSDVGDRWSSR